MTRNTLLAHVLFAALALVFAYAMANRVKEKKGGPTSVVLLDAKKGDVTRISYTWPKGTSTVTSSGAEATRAVVVEVNREIEKKDKKKKDDKKEAKDGEEATPEAAEPPQREEAKFPGGKGVLTALEAFEPLKTRRTLGEVDPGRLAAMGLEKPERTLVVTAGAKTLTLEIGEASYGGQGRYARVKGENRVHLLDNAIVTGLEGGADALMEKRVVVVEPEKVKAFDARHGDKIGSFVHVNRDQTAARHFAKKGDTSTKDETATKLMATLRAVRATKLAAPMNAGSSVASFALEIEDRPKAQLIEVLERVDGEGYLIKNDDWLFEISQTQGKELIEDLDAALE